MLSLLEQCYGDAFDIQSYLVDFEGDKEPRTIGGSGLTGTDLAEMSKRKLLKLVKDRKLDIEDDEWEDLDELREIIMEELDVPPF